MEQHFILTHGRSGSNYLTEVIDQHPRLVNYGEVFGAWAPSHRLHRRALSAGKDSAEFLDELYRSPAYHYRRQLRAFLAAVRRRRIPAVKLQSKVRSVGVKEFTFKLAAEGLLEYLPARPWIRVIRLHRSNLFHRYLSRLQMSRSEVARTERSLPGPEPLTVDLEEMEREIAIMRAEADQEARLLSSLRGNPVLEIHYEESFRNDACLLEMSRRVFSFLGVEPLGVLGRQRRIVQQPPAAWVRNYAECANRLRSSGDARWLADGSAEA